MAKLQLQLNGQAGLAPNHYGNSLYTASNPNLKYVGQSGQKAEGIYWSNRYNGYMSPLPNAYQDVLFFENTPTEPSASAIKMAFTDRSDTETGIVFADDTGLYKANKTPTIDGIVGAFDFVDPYSTPVYNRDYGVNYIDYSSLTTKKFEEQLFNIDDTYFVSAYKTELNNGQGIIETYKLENGTFETLDTYVFADTGILGNFDMKKIDDTHFVIGYEDTADGAGDTGYVAIFVMSSDYTSITRTQRLEFANNDNPSEISVGVKGTDKVGILYNRADVNDGYLNIYSLSDTLTTLTLDSANIVNSTDEISDTELISLDGENWATVFLDETTGSRFSSIRTHSNELSGAFTAGVLNTDNIFGGNFQRRGIKITDEIFAFVFTDTNNDGRVVTMSFDGTTYTTIQNYEFETTQALDVDIKRVSGTKYVIAYSGVSNHGFLKIVEITTSGVITDIETLEHESSDPVKQNNLLPLDETHFVLSYTNATTNELVIKVFEYTSSLSEISSVAILSDATSIVNNGIIRLDNNNYAITYYTGSSADVFTSTFEINSSYIAQAPYSTVLVEVTGSQSSIAKLKGNYYAVAMRDNSSNLTIYVYSYDPTTYVISSVTNALVTTDAFYPYLLSDGNTLFVQHEDGGNDTWLRGYTFNGSSSLLPSTALQFNSTNTDFNSLFMLNDTTLISLFEGTTGQVHSFDAISVFVTNEQLQIGTGNVAQRPTAINIGSNNYLIKYNDIFDDNKTKIDSFNITSDGSITFLSSFELETDTLGLFKDNIFVSGSNVFTSYYDSVNNISSIEILNLSGTTISSGEKIQLLNSIRYSDQINIVDNDILFTYYSRNDFYEIVTVRDYQEYLTLIQSGNPFINAPDITDVTRSQFAGAVSYYYIWGNKIGRASSLANIGTEVDATNTIEWINRSNNNANLAALRSENPHFINTKNQYIYILDGESIHGINVSLSGTTEDVDGTLDADLILFQAGVKLIDGVDNNENIYLSLVEGNSSVDLWNLPTDTSTKTNCYVYVWNKISGQSLQANRIELTDCKHVGKGFAMNGNIYFMTINDSNVSEIRMLSRGGFTVLHEIGADSEFNIGKQSITVTELGAIIATNKGNLFLLDKNNELKKLGTFADDIDESAPALVIYGGGEGHEPSNIAQGLQTVVPHLTITYRTSGGVNKIKKFFLRNQGTMLNEYKGFTPTTEQQTWLDTNVPELPLVANEGNVYTLVNFLPKLSDLKECVIYCKPTGIVTEGEVTEIAKLKLYKNQKTEPFFTHSVTDKNASRGYLEFNLDESNVNAVQIEVEYNTSLPIGDNDFTPLTGVLEYTPTGSRK